MKLLLMGIAVIFGLITGSFLNVCIYRIPRRISIVKGNHGRSMCPDCGKTLKGYDMIPVFSYLFLGAKCRYCKKHISFRYPLVEFTNAALWGFCALRFGYEWKALIGCLYCSILLVLAIIDINTQEIPYRFQIMILCLAFVSLFLPGFPDLKARLIGLAAVSVPMAVLTLIMNGFGGGDIQLMAVSGLLLGWKAGVAAMLIGTVSAGAIGMVILGKNRNREKKILIPFGPFLAVGLIIAMFYGDSMIDWYLHHFII